jgi:hypothetical protein
MILNVNKKEVNLILELIAYSEDRCIGFADSSNLREKLKRLQTTSEPVKSTIEQVRTTE